MRAAATVLGLALSLAAIVERVASAAEGILTRPGGGIAFVLAVDPKTAGTIYAGAARGGIFQSTDAGKTWRRLARSPRPARINALAVDGTGRLLAGIDRGGVFQSTDSLERWILVATGEPTEEVDSLVVDRRTSPETIFAGTAAGAVRRSVDGGKTWTAIGSGLPARPIQVLALDSPAHPNGLWAGTVEGLYRSDDGGSTWSSAHPVPIRRLLVDPTRRGTLFAVQDGVFRSTDDGVTWRRLPVLHNALSVTVDASTAPAAVYVGTSYNSVLKTTDGGETWTAAAGGLPPLAEVVELAADTRTKPSTLYATTSTLGIYRSTDGGASWQIDEGPVGGVTDEPPSTD
jgi:photosystem II stability/assembly factor-like uncharacterized protein